jgi:hypothetical protein
MPSHPVLSVEPSAAVSRIHLPVETNRWRIPQIGKRKGGRSAVEAIVLVNQVADTLHGSSSRPEVAAGPGIR